MPCEVAADNGAGAADTAQTMQVNRFAGLDIRVNRIKNCGHFDAGRYPHVFYGYSIKGNLTS